MKDIKRQKVMTELKTARHIQTKKNILFFINNIKIVIIKSSETITKDISWFLF